ncbi:MAG: hypothetical protein WCI77_07815 [Candidatus Omnitrophota bacterium]
MKQFLGTVLVLLMAAGFSVAAGLYFTKDYQTRLHALEQQGKLADQDIDSIQEIVSNLKTNIEAINTQFKMYADSATAVEGKIKISQEKIEAISFKIDEINKNIQSLQKSYNTMAVEPKQQTQASQGSTTIVKVEDVKKVDLGEIAVQKAEPR